MRAYWRVRLGVVVILLTLASPGCFQDDEQIYLNADGSGRFARDLKYDVRVVAGLAQMTGARADAGDNLLLDPMKLLARLVANTGGVDVWSEARAEGEPGGQVHVVLRGYFKDVGAYRAASATLAMPTLADRMPDTVQPDDLGPIALSTDEKGNRVLTYPEGPGREPGPRRASPPALPEMTEEEKENLERGRMALALAINMAAPVLRGSRLRREIVVGGEITDSGLFARPEPGRAVLVIEPEKVLAAVSALIQDDKVARALLARGGSGEQPGPGSKKAGFDDPEIEALVHTAVFGKSAPARIVFRPGAPLFDYDKESRAAAASQPEQLKELLAKAKAASVVDSSGTEVEKPEFNFKLRLPPGWVTFPAEAANPEACLGFRRGSVVFGMVSAVQLPLVSDAAAMEALVKSGVEANGGRILEQKTEPVVLGDRRFTRISMVVKMPSLALDLRIENWLVMRGGGVWQIVVWGKRADDERILQDARTIAEGFHLLDPDRGVPGRDAAAQDVERPQWGYSLKGASAGWVKLAPDPEANGLSFLVDLCWMRTDEAVVVVPVRFDGPVPDLPALVRGLAGAIGFDYPGDGSYKTAEWKNPLGEGVEVSTDRVREKKDYRHVLRVARGRSSAILLAGWYSLADGDPGKVLSTLDAVALTEPQGEVPEPTAEHKRFMGFLYNDVGLSYQDRKLFEPAVAYFAAAFEAAGGDATVLDNWIGALAEGGNSRAALDALSSRIGRFADDPGLRFRLAVLQLETGDPPAANESFLQAVKLGLDDEDRLIHWMQRMVAGGRVPLAVAAASAWIEKRPSLNVRRWHAQAVRESGDVARALELLRPLASEYPDDLPVVYDLGITLNAAKRYAEAGELAARLLAEHPDDATLLAIAGWSQMGLDRYREAKASFEKAAKAAPGDTGVEDGLRLASAMMGQGSNSGIKEPIEMVPLPPELAEAARQPVAPDFGKGFPAVALFRAEGVAVRPGRPTRYTMHSRIRINSQEGVAAYGTLLYLFDSLEERMFIHRIEVKDANGVVASSGVEDAFVVDGAQSEASWKKMLKVPVRGIRAGCVLEAVVSREKLSAEGGLEFIRHVFAHPLPAATGAVFLDGDLAGVAIALRNGAGVTESRKEMGAIWIAQPQNVEKDEPLAVPLDDRAPVLSIGARRESWKAVGLEYLESIDDVLRPEDTVAALAVRLTAEAKSDRSRIEVLARFVQREIHYKAIHFGPHAFRPNEVSRILVERFGDCKDHALLLHHLLRAVGIPSHLALVSTEWRTEPAIPSLDQFDHMVLHVPSLGDGWLLDATEKRVPLERYPAFRLAGQTHALVLDPEAPKLVELPEPAFEGMYDVNIRREVTPDGGDWVVRETATVDGIGALFVRMAFADVSPGDRSGQMQANLDASGSVQVREFEFDGLDDPSKPAVLRIGYVVKNAVTSAEGHSRGSLPAFLEQKFLRLPFVADRESAFEQRYPLHLTSEVAVRLPAEPQGAEDGGSPQADENEYCAWRVERKRGDRPGEFVIRLDFKAKPGKYAAGRYAEAQRAFDLPLARLDRPVVW